MRTVLSFIEKERRYALLLGAVMSVLSLLMQRSQPSELSFLGRHSASMHVFAAICSLFLLLSLCALVVRLIRGRSFRKSVFRQPGMLRITMYLFWLVLISFSLIFIDRAVLGLICYTGAALTASSKPQSFYQSMVYMFSKGKTMFALGVWTTVRIALMGTAIAFVLAVLMAFMRIQSPNKRDDDLVRLLKLLGSGFARLYITVIRGTPMMVQALIFYYAGFSIFKGTGMTVTEINRVWSFFISGLITVSLNSTAYLAEVLRGGIEAVDPGQIEAARSLGLSTWKAMLNVVFPQALKNSIPAIGNEFIINIKDSSVLSVIGVFDLMYATTTVNGIYYGSLPIYCVAAVLYLILTYCSSLIMKGISRKLGVTPKELPGQN